MFHFLGSIDSYREEAAKFIIFVHGIGTCEEDILNNLALHVMKKQFDEARQDARQLLDNPISQWEVETYIDLLSVICPDSELVA